MTALAIAICVLWGLAFVPWQEGDQKSFLVVASVLGLVMAILVLT